jgi:Uma2 family endonuclease
MTISKPIGKHWMTLDEYVHYDDDTDTRYELVNGELVAMPTENDINGRIALFLVLQLAQLVPHRLLRCNSTAIAVSGSRATTRIPDVMVLSEELAMALEQAEKSVITFDMPSPVLVIEVVSPGKLNQDRDYRYKRSEYAARCIPEYWIIDPSRAMVTVLALVDGLYESVEYQGNQTIVSSTFSELRLTAEQVLEVGAGH